MATLKRDEPPQGADQRRNVMTPVSSPAFAVAVRHRKEGRHVGPDSGVAQWQDGLVEFMGPIDDGDD